MKDKNAGLSAFHFQLPWVAKALALSRFCVVSLMLVLCVLIDLQLMYGFKRFFEN